MNDKQEYFFRWWKENWKVKNDLDAKKIVNEAKAELSIEDFIDFLQLLIDYLQEKITELES